MIWPAKPIHIYESPQIWEDLLRCRMGLAYRLLAGLGELLAALAAGAILFAAAGTAL